MNTLVFLRLQAWFGKKTRDMSRKGKAASCCRTPKGAASSICLGWSNAKMRPINKIKNKNLVTLVTPASSPVPNLMVGTKFAARMTITAQWTLCRLSISGHSQTIPHIFSRRPVMKLNWKLVAKIGLFRCSVPRHSPSPGASPNNRHCSCRPQRRATSGRRFPRAEPHLCIQGNRRNPSVCRVRFLQGLQR